MFAVLWVGGAAFHPHGRVFCVCRLFLVYSQRRSTCTFVVEVCSRKNVTSASRMHVFCGLPSEALESRLFWETEELFHECRRNFLRQNKPVSVTTFDSLAILSHGKPRRLAE